MSGFAAFAAAFCTVCVILGGLLTLCPEGAMSKAVRYVFGLVFIIAVISSVVGIKNTNITFSLPTDAQPDSDEMLIASAEYAFSYALKKNGIDFSKITVCTDKSENGGISISRVIVYSGCDAGKITAALSGTAGGFEVEIINE